MVKKTETFKTIRQMESPTFVQQELESIGLDSIMEGLGIWKKMEEIGKIEPAIRCAKIASHAAFKFKCQYMCLETINFVF